MDEHISKAIKSLVATIDNLPLSHDDEHLVYVTIGMLTEYRSDDASI